MTTTQHTVLSAAVSGVLYAAFRSVEPALWAFVWGVALDIDHVLDYLREYGARFNARLFFGSFEQTRYHRTVLLFHGWEWIAIWGAATWLSGWSAWALGLTVGTAHHLIADQWTNSPGAWGYSLVWRARHRFLATKAFPHTAKPPAHVP